MVVMRSTRAPDWDRGIWAGNVREFTIPNIPMDELVFGVKAVDRDGHESPVSAYFTQPKESQPLRVLRHTARLTLIAQIEEQIPEFFVDASTRTNKEDF